MTMQAAALYSNHARFEALAAAQDAITEKLTTVAFEVSAGQWIVTSQDVLTGEVVQVGFRPMEA